MSVRDPQLLLPRLVNTCAQYGKFQREKPFNVFTESTQFMKALHLIQWFRADSGQISQPIIYTHPTASCISLPALSSPNVICLNFGKLAIELHVLFISF